MPHIADLSPARNLTQQRLEAVFAKTKSIRMTPDCKRRLRMRLTLRPLPALALKLAQNPHPSLFVGQARSEHVIILK
jgi:hypothetical protein